LVRRARLKASHAGDRSSYTFQIDATEKAVELRDAYVNWKPRSNFTLWAGQFKVPFGFEIEQSSSDREMPERAEVIRKLFPGERDRGLRVTYLPSHKTALDLALFNGNGVVTTPDLDNHKDVVARVRHTVSPTVHFAVSGYLGKALVGASKAVPDTQQKMTGDFNGDGTPETIEVTIPGKSAVPGVYGTRSRIGADLQIYNLMGNTLRAEWIKAKQPDSRLGSVEAEGWYALLNRPFGPKWLFTARYDVYDPNTSAQARNDRLSTWGFAITHHATANTTFTAVCELPKKQAAPGTNAVFTFQAQQKF
ncbi:MAG: porin, partial [Armatimonadota bacterium]